MRRWRLAIGLGVAVGAGVFAFAARERPGAPSPNPARGNLMPSVGDAMPYAVPTPHSAPPVVAPATPRMLPLMATAALEQVQVQFPFVDVAAMAEGGQLLSLDHGLLAGLAPGDQFTWPIADQPPRQALVESVIEHEGMRRFRGSLFGAGDAQAEGFSMTLASDRSYVAGHLRANGREYSLQSRNGKGWVGTSAAAARLDRDEVPAGAPSP